MGKSLYTSRGVSVEIGSELGKGGEGSVFEVRGLPSQVAKLYHKLPDAKKQAKLSFMAETADQKLLGYVAWPQDTLHKSPGGPVVGFLMPKVSGKDPIHMVYSPAHRRRERPQAAWDYLLFVARNTAAAFETLHAHGHVVGDVNQGNVMVGNDSKVVLIDSDSFQVNARGTVHHCEVGVSHFTPPELQGLSSFVGFTRSTNHDTFGLALIIFHLLFGGRHPYAGVPLRNGVGESLEGDIKAFRYAYSRDAKNRGLTPPPASIPVSMLPSELERMFQLTFTEPGVQQSRPSASQWVAALDDLRGRLKKCSMSKMHLYPDHQSTCPWCALEQQGIVYFVDLGTSITAVQAGPTHTSVSITQIWALVEAVKSFPSLQVPQPTTISVTPAPLPAGIPGRGRITFYKTIVVVTTIVVMVELPVAWFIWLIAGLVGWSKASSAGSASRSFEYNKRKAAKDAAEQEYGRLVAQVKREAGPEGFVAKKSELAKLRDEYQSLPQAEKSELDRLQSTAEQRQKQRFLEGFFIDQASISGVGQARKAALRSFGIETAADVVASKVRQVRGFGESLTRAMTDWRASCERKFRFDPGRAVSDSDRNAVKVKYAARRSAVETMIRSGPGELQRFADTAASRARVFQPQLLRAAQQLAQANADLSLL